MTLPNRRIEDIADELHAVFRRETADIVTIGNLLAEARGRVAHGGWLPWLRNEFCMSERTAQKYVKAADFAGKYELDADLKLSPSALFLISRYDHREIAEAMIKAARETHVGCDQAKKIIDETLLELNSTNPAGSEEDAPGGIRRHGGSRSGVSQRDLVVFRFTTAVTELHKVIEPHRVDRFAKSVVEEDVLARVGQLLNDLANLKAKRGALEASVDKAA